MTHSGLAFLVMAVAMLTSALVFPKALKFAQKHDIVDNPNARKLQRLPVPVFGGVVVYSGILIGGLVLGLFVHNSVLLWGLAAMSVMLIIGMWDDIRDISAVLRFLTEIALVSAFILITKVYIDDFHGLWGINHLDPWLGIPLSVLVGVGIINAVNLIDGVDGYSSGYGMMSCLCFAGAFWTVWSPIMCCSALLVVGALFPFFMHNVFGSKSRMFIGDGGTLMLGMMMVVLTFYSMWSGSKMDSMEELNFSIPGFIIAVGCIPLFDTLRVMMVRILRGSSPFKPDKTHLHHLFIDMGFSHLGAALFILLMNFLVVIIFLVTWKLGASIDIQTYVVIAVGLLVTFGFYKFMKIQQNSGQVDEEGYPQGTALWHKMCDLGKLTHRENKRTWRMLQWLMDVPLMGGGVR